MGVPDGLAQVGTVFGDGTVTVTVNGEVDIATVADLRAGLTEALGAQPRRLVVDLASTTFIDCSGMRVIRQAGREASPECTVILRSPNRLARKVIELTGMDRECLIDPEQTLP
jgi:anti-anti-sigma factor